MQLHRPCSSAGLTTMLHSSVSPQPARCAWRQRRPGRCVDVRAKLAADKPQHTPEPTTNTNTSNTNNSSSTSDPSSGCPVLHALASATPPEVHVPWHKRLQQYSQPWEFQQLLLDGAVAQGHQMAAVSKSIGFADAYMPATGDAVRTVLAGEAGLNPITSNTKAPVLVTLLGANSLVLAADPQHKFLRGLLTPAFSSEAINRYLPEVVGLMQRHLQEWADAGEGGVKGLDALKLLTFEFIVQLTLGRSYTRQELLVLSDAYQDWVGGLSAWPWLNIPFTPFARALKARDTMIRHFQEATDAGRAQLARGQEVPGLLGILLSSVDEEGNRLSDAQITDNILLLLLAGHDTSSTALTQCFSNLQDHPAVLQQLRAEQQALVRKHGQTITPAVLRDMVYADAVIKETMRLDPVVGSLHRVAAQDFELVGYKVPKGKLLMLPLKYLAAHDARFEADSPHAFRPERMLTAEAQKKGDQMPFGYGPRYCLGAGLALVEMKVLLALVARHYSFTCDNNTEWVQAIGRVPKNKLPMVVKPLAA